MCNVAALSQSCCARMAREGLPKPWLVEPTAAVSQPSGCQPAPRMASLGDLVRETKKKNLGGWKKKEREGMSRRRQRQQQPEAQTLAERITTLIARIDELDRKREEEEQRREEEERRTAEEQAAADGAAPEKSEQRRWSRQPQLLLSRALHDIASDNAARKQHAAARRQEVFRRARAAAAAALAEAKAKAKAQIWWRKNDELWE